jgi:hypothetical protein
MAVAAADRHGDKLNLDDARDRARCSPCVLLILARHHVGHQWHYPPLSIRDPRAGYKTCTRRMARRLTSYTSPAMLAFTLVSAALVALGQAQTPISAVVPGALRLLNATVQGRLHAALPYSAPCYSTVNGVNVGRDDAACAAVEAGYTNPLSRVAQFGAYMVRPYFYVRVIACSDFIYSWCDLHTLIAFQILAHSHSCSRTGKPARPPRSSVFSTTRTHQTHFPTRRRTAPRATSPPTTSVSSILVSPSITECCPDRYPRSLGCFGCLGVLQVDGRVTGGQEQRSRLQGPLFKEGRARSLGRSYPSRCEVCALITPN